MPATRSRRPTSMRTMNGLRRARISCSQRSTRTSHSKRSRVPRPARSARPTASELAAGRHVDPQGGHDRQPGCSESSFSELFASLRSANHSSIYSAASFWWTVGGGDYPPLAFCCRRMPDPFLFTKHADRPSQFRERVELVRGFEMERATATFETGAATHVGKVRKRNEDSYLARPEAGHLGSGRWDGGARERRSRESHRNPGAGIDSTAALRRATCSPCAKSAFSMPTPASTKSAVSAGASSSARPSRFCSPSMAILLACGPATAECTWCEKARSPKSRAIIPRCRISSANGAITPEEAQTWPGSNVITRAIGVGDVPELEMTSGPLNAGDVFVMCSDGLTRHVEDEEILRCVSANVSQQACERLVLLTLERGAAR